MESRADPKNAARDRAPAQKGEDATPRGRVKETDYGLAGPLHNPAVGTRGRFVEIDFEFAIQTVALLMTPIRSHTAWTGFQRHCRSPPA